MPIFRTDASIANGGESVSDRENTNSATIDTNYRTWDNEPVSPDQFFYLREPNNRNRIGSGGQRDPIPNGGGTGATAGGKNPLHKFSSYSWMWSLSCLSKGQTNFPDSIKGQFTPGIPVAVDMGASDYHFDTMRVLGLTAPNAHIRNTHSITFEFDINEPYSLGNFIEDLDDAASAQGWANYIDAGWALGLKFDGWDDNGYPGSVGPFNFVVKLLEAKFKYTEAGTVYKCKAIAWNDQAWNEENATVKTSGILVGNKLKELAFYSQNSLTALLNNQELKNAEKGNITEGDSYYVVFPSTKTSAEEAAVLFTPSAGPQDFPVKWVQDWDKERGREYKKGNGDGPGGFTGNSSGDTGVRVRLGAWIADNKEFNLGGSKGAQTNAAAIYDFYFGNCNEIGESEITKHPFDLIKNRNVPARNCRSNTHPNIMQNRYCFLDENAFTFPVTAGSKIIDVIEELILASKWGREKGIWDSPDGNNKVRWWKVQCWVIASDGAKESDSGRTAKTYIYRVIEHKAAANRVAKPGSKGKGGGGPARIYNYVYTGLNNDVLDIDLEWNAAFYVPLQADLGHNEATTVIGVPDQQAPRDPDIIPKQSVGGAGGSPDGVMQTHTPSQRARMRSFTAKRTESAANRDWHNILMNSDVDLLNLDMKIHGDPVYLQSNGCGNYIAGADGNLTKDGDLEYINSEADIQINFNTPPDLGVPWTPVGQYRFTGLYQVVQVQSDFTKSEGFTQTLKCIRYRNQGGGASSPVFEQGGEMSSDEPHYTNTPKE